jgi:hypothetical protein
VYSPRGSSGAAAGARPAASGAASGARPPNARPPSSSAAPAPAAATPGRTAVQRLPAREEQPPHRLGEPLHEPPRQPPLEEAGQHHVARQPLPAREPARDRHLRQRRPGPAVDRRGEPRLDQPPQRRLAGRVEAVEQRVAQPVGHAPVAEPRERAERRDAARERRRRVAAVAAREHRAADGQRERPGEGGEHRAPAQPLEALGPEVRTQLEDERPDDRGRGRRRPRDPRPRAAAQRRRERARPVAVGAEHGAPRREPLGERVEGLRLRRQHEEAERVGAQLAGAPRRQRQRGEPRALRELGEVAGPRGRAAPERSSTAPASPNTSSRWPPCRLASCAKLTARRGAGVRSSAPAGRARQQPAPGDCSKCSSSMATPASRSARAMSSWNAAWWSFAEARSTSTTYSGVWRSGR